MLPYGRMTFFFGSEFSSEELARLIMDAFVGGCIVAIYPENFVTGTPAIAVDSSTPNEYEIDFTGEIEGPGGSSATLYEYMSAFLAVGTLTVAWNVTSASLATTGSSVSIVVKQSDGTIIDTHNHDFTSSPESGTYDVTIADEGVYLIELTVNISVTSGPVTPDILIGLSHTDAFIINPVTASFIDIDDEVRTIDACAYWNVSDETYQELGVFGNASIALDWITSYDGTPYSPYTGDWFSRPVDCWMIARGVAGILSSLSSSFSSGTLVLAGTNTCTPSQYPFPGYPPTLQLIAELEMVSGETITVAWSATSSGGESDPSWSPIIGVTLIEPSPTAEVDNDIVSWSGTSDSGSLSVTAPYSGRFLLACFCNPDNSPQTTDQTLTCSFSATSSGTIMPLEVAAKYLINSTYVPDPFFPAAGTWESDYPCQGLLTCPH